MRNKNEVDFRKNKVDGYRGIWYSLGQLSEYGDKYSGGLGTYTANHNPMAVYSRESNKTFFVYGGTPDPHQRYLQCMAGCYDHGRGMVQKPRLVHDKGAEGVDDPHDDPSICLDDAGYLWVFVAGRNISRNGTLYKSATPYSIDAFERVLEYKGMTYPQPWCADSGFLFMFTKYASGNNRELYFSSSPDGAHWRPDRRLVGFGGHYQVTGYDRSRHTLGSFFNYHPNHSVDARTNLYYMQSTDGGESWTNVEGSRLDVPLDTVQNPALVIDLESQGLLQYTCDLNWDAAGHPLLLYVTSAQPHPGPQGNPRKVSLSRWNGQTWVSSVVCSCTHNYDMGSLYVDGQRWTVIFPSGNGPQEWGTGGEVEIWVSEDFGATWEHTRNATEQSERNHAYVRRPLDATDPFAAFWVDGHADKLSKSELYFCNSTGARVWRLPYEMSEEWQAPLEVTQPADTTGS